MLKTFKAAGLFALIGDQATMAAGGSDAGAGRMPGPDLATRQGIDDATLDDIRRIVPSRRCKAPPTVRALIAGDR